MDYLSQYCRLYKKKKNDMTALSLRCLSGFVSGDVGHIVTTYHRSIRARRHEINYNTLNTKTPNELFSFHYWRCCRDRVRLPSNV